MRTENVIRLRRIVALPFMAGMASPALATDGYYAQGYGMKAKGMGGASTAMAIDLFGGTEKITMYEDSLGLAYGMKFK